MCCPLRLTRKRQLNHARFPGRNERNFSDYVKERNSPALPTGRYSYTLLAPLWSKQAVQTCCILLFDNHLLHMIKGQKTTVANNSRSATKINYSSKTANISALFSRKFREKIFAKKPLFAILVAQKSIKPWGNEYIWAWAQIWEIKSKSSKKPSTA